MNPEATPVGDGYPWDVPPPSTDPPMTDKDALDYLTFVLGDRASSAEYVWQAACLVVMRTGRTIQRVTGD